ncbi:MAG: DMT family protein [Myxococcales bacterium]|nr:DMT family protein [Myxococcales bacterium]
MDDRLKAIAMLLLSNTFMTVAWYGHLRFKHAPLLVAVLASWGIAFFEYMLQVPANRIGYRSLSAYQLKVIQEAIALLVFMGFAAFWLGEGLRPRYALAFALILCAVAVAVR